MIPAKKDVIFYNAQYSMMEYYLNDVLVKELITSSRDGARNHLERQGIPNPPFINKTLLRIYGCAHTNVRLPAKARPARNTSIIRNRPSNLSGQYGALNDNVLIQKACFIFIVIRF